MKMNSAIKAYVKRADGSIVEVWSSSNKFSNILLANGFVRNDENTFAFTTTSDENKAKVFNWLRNGDVLFAAGREWSPSEVFEYLRDKNLVTGTYQQLVWLGPELFQVRVC